MTIYDTLTPEERARIDEDISGVVEDKKLNTELEILRFGLQVIKNNTTDGDYVGSYFYLKALAQKFLEAGANKCSADHSELTYETPCPRCGK